MGKLARLAPLAFAVFALGACAEPDEEEPVVADEAELVAKPWPTFGQPGHGLLGFYENLDARERPGIPSRIELWPNRRYLLVLDGAHEEGTFTYTEQKTPNGADSTYRVILSNGKAKRTLTVRTSDEELFDLKRLTLDGVDVGTLRRHQVEHEGSTAPVVTSITCRFVERRGENVAYTSRSMPTTERSKAGDLVVYSMGQSSYGRRDIHVSPVCPLPGRAVTLVDRRGYGGESTSAIQSGNRIAFEHHYLVPGLRRSEEGSCTGTIAIPDDLCAR